MELRPACAGRQMPTQAVARMGPGVRACHLWYPVSLTHQSWSDYLKNDHEPNKQHILGWADGKKRKLETSFFSISETNILIFESLKRIWMSFYSGFKVWRPFHQNGAKWLNTGRETKSESPKRPTLISIGSRAEQSNLVLLGHGFETWTSRWFW